MSDADGKLINWRKRGVIDFEELEFFDGTKFEDLPLGEHRGVAVGRTDGELNPNDTSGASAPFNTAS